jgi:hypothetical protein
MTDRTDRILDAALIAAIWIALVAMMFFHAARVGTTRRSLSRTWPLRGCATKYIQN